MSALFSTDKKRTKQNEINTLLGSQNVFGQNGKSDLPLLGVPRKPSEKRVANTLLGGE